MEEDKKERLLRQHQQGERSRVTIYELDEWLNTEKKAIVSKLPKAKTPEEAFYLAMQLRVLEDFVSCALANSAIGDSAGRQLLEGE